MWDYGPHMALVAHAVLLSDHGGPELETACQRLEQLKDPNPKITTRPRFVAETARWARDRAARLTGQRDTHTDQPARAGAGTNGPCSRKRPVSEMHRTTD